MIHKKNIIFITVFKEIFCRDLFFHKEAFKTKTYIQDTFVKFWDLTTQHCFKTLTGHVTEIWDLVLLQEDKILVTGGSDAELKIWKLEFQESEGEGEEDGGTKSRFVTKEPQDKKVRTELEEEG